MDANGRSNVISSTSSDSTDNERRPCREASNNSWSTTQTVTQTLSNLQQMARAKFIEAEDVETLEPVVKRYPAALTPALAELIDPTDEADPIARQFVPSLEELYTADEDLPDPIGDERHSPVRGIVHRYADRVLLKLTHVCPVYCRFCFRREMVGGTNGPGLSKPELETALQYIKDHGEVWEVIFTGGDPLVLSPRKLSDVTKRVASFDHVKIVRWHTRMPVAKPSAISSELIDAMKATQKTTYVVLHANHPRELTHQVRSACARLIDAGIILLSQSVLLKGVNNDIDTLECLMRSLVESGVKPYYLHHADLAPGTAHFRTEIEEGQKLMRALHARASGVCLPTYVLDIPGGYAKARMELCDAEQPPNSDAAGAATTLLRDGQGKVHPYPAVGSKR
jgi:lysine 2,3-aminomutase